MKHRNMPLPLHGFEFRLSQLREQILQGKLTGMYIDATLQGKVAWCFACKCSSVAGHPEPTERAHAPVTCPSTRETRSPGSRTFRAVSLHVQTSRPTQEKTCMAAVQCKQDRQRQYRTLLFEYIASSREGARRQNWCGIPCFF